MKYVRELDGIRALCVIGVFLFHCFLLDCGWVGVQAFFVLSGFLITGVLLEGKAEDPSAKAFFRNFYARRVLRIFPVYLAYIGLIVLAGLFGIGGGEASAALRAHNAWHAPYLLTYTYNFAYINSVAGSPFYGHLWSLSVEEQFYLLWPLGVFLLSRKGLVRLCLLLVCSGPLIRLAEVLLLQRMGPMPDPPAKIVYFLTMSHLDAFAIGALLNFRAENSLAGTLVALPGRKILLALALASALILLAAQRTRLGMTFSSLGWPLYLPDLQMPVWGYTVLDFAFFIAIARAQEITWLNRPSLQRLGRVSYGFYIFHRPMILLAEELAHVGPGFNLYSLVVCSLAFVATWLVAELSFLVLESPLLRLKRRFATATSTREGSGGDVPVSAALPAARARD